MTKWSEIITDYALVEIDDIRLSEELAENPSAFFRKMSLYMKNAIPRFNRPHTMAERLVSVPPHYDSYEWTADGSRLVKTGKTWYELCCACIIGEDQFRNPTVTPIRDIEYVADYGMVRMPWLEPGTKVTIDFYKDGYFREHLTPEEKRILGLCVQLVWEARFSGNWLDRTPKVKDKTFDMGSEANQMRANSDRFRMLENSLNQELNRFEQNLAYRKTFGTGKRFGKRF